MRTFRAILLFLLGEVALMFGLALSPVPWLAFVTAGLQCIALGLVHETDARGVDS